MRVRNLTMKQIGEYFNKAHLLRPISKAVVDRFAMLMETGEQFPSIVLATYPEEKGKGRMIIDGAHVFQGCVTAKVSKHPCEFMAFDSLADAVAEQLRRNIKHGTNLSTAQRDEKIRELLKDYRWTVRKVAQSIGLHYASISRINRGLQNVSKTGKRGAATARKQAAARGTVVPHALPPTQFIRQIQNLSLTLTKADAKQQVLAEIYSTKRKPQEVQKLVQLLQEVAMSLNALVAAPVQPLQTARRSRPAAQALQVAA